MKIRHRLAMNKATYVRNLLWVAVLIAPLTTVEAAPILASISGCTAASCTVTPSAGPVVVDADGFTLEVDWAPEHIALIEPNDDRGEWLLQLTFDVTGTPDGTEGFGNIDLIDMSGGAILLIVGFDDVTNFVPVLRANYEIFGPDVLETFFVHGFDLGISQVRGNNVGLAWTGATFIARNGSIDRGVWSSVPEPTTILLLGLGLAGLGFARRRQH